MADPSSNSRRRFLHLAGVTALSVGLAGCGDGGGGDGEDGGGDGENGDGTTTEAGGGMTTGGGGGTATGGGGTTTGGGGMGTATVAEAERTATSQGGQQRDPSGLVSPESLNYQDQPKNGQQCSGCQFYVPDANGDGMGACTVVSGPVSPEGWCSSWTAYQTTTQ